MLQGLSCRTVELSPWTVQLVLQGLSCRTAELSPWTVQLVLRGLSCRTAELSPWTVQLVLLCLPCRTVELSPWTVQLVLRGLPKGHHKIDTLPASSYLKMSLSKPILPCRLQSFFGGCICKGNNCSA